MNQREEQAYIRGERAVYRELLGVAVRGLGGKERTAAQLRAELEDARAALRRICSEHGDNDWEDDLRLADVLEKHLGRYLEERKGQRGG